MQNNIRQATGRREIWVDNVKVIACILVVLGHFFQSMVKANILPDDDIYRWFNQTIYYFHVPLFFICSGYLYQRFGTVNSIQNWGEHILKKALNLGIPYFTFSFLTWALKTLFSGSVNDEIGGLADTLFIHPTSPYWYLYALFFLFLITPKFRTKIMACIGLIIATGFKILEIVWGGVYPVISYILGNEIWFVLGMCMNVWDFRRHIEKFGKTVPIVLFICFTGLSVLIYRIKLQSGFVNFALGLMACISVIALIMMLFKNNKQVPVFQFLTQYTLPIFLMHTLFAAPMRVLLIKLGILNPVIHIALGLIISFCGPIIAAIIMKKTKWLEFFLYPTKFIEDRKVRKTSI